METSGSRSCNTASTPTLLTDRPHMHRLGPIYITGEYVGFSAGDEAEVTNRSFQGKRRMEVAIPGRGFWLIFVGAVDSGGWFLAR